MIDINTTRNTSGDMKTTTSGAGVGGAGLGELFKALIAQKLAAQQQPAKAPLLGKAEAAPMRSSYSDGPGPMQAAPKKEEIITRQVHDPQANPYQKLATGMDIPMVNERGFRDKNGNIQWEFQDIRPHGSSGGFDGGGAESSLHPTSNLQAKMPANRTGSPEQGLEDAPINYAQAGQTAAGVARNRAPINPYNRNNDARGEGFGMDYNRRRPAKA